ncbi:hypothetical protein I546_2199 [Mycobacterium kansasii 732]|nr:hypothetical protein I546_2199 [Mycobacterium kansasii 732]
MSRRPGPGQSAALYTHGAFCTCGRVPLGRFHRWPGPSVHFAPAAGSHWEDFTAGPARRCILHLRPAGSGEINLLPSLRVRHHQRQFITAGPTRGG